MSETEKIIIPVIHHEDIDVHTMGRNNGHREILIPVRVVTATALFDGHDVAVNLIRRLLLSAGAEVIHLGHSRSAKEIVRCAIQEDAQAIAITSYQGGHLEFFKYIYDLLQEQNAGHIRIFGGGGGTILPLEMDALHAYGIERLYSPEDGRAMGLEGMIADMLGRCRLSVPKPPEEIIPMVGNREDKHLGALLTMVADHPGTHTTIREALSVLITPTVPVIGITGTGGAGKSSLIDELLRRFWQQFPDKKAAVICVDPSRRKTGGGLLGDRIRINSAANENVFIRSLATRGAYYAIAQSLPLTLELCKGAGFDMIIVETPGMGQADMGITEYVDVSLYVMTADFGAPSQLEKINILDYADAVAVNKSDKGNVADAVEHVRRQYRLNHNLNGLQDEDIPVVSTNASVYNDEGVTALFQLLLKAIREKTGCLYGGEIVGIQKAMRQQIIPPYRNGYLDEIIQVLNNYTEKVNQQSDLAQQLFQLNGAATVLLSQPFNVSQRSLLEQQLQQSLAAAEEQLDPATKEILRTWEDNIKRYQQDEAVLHVNGKEVTYQMHVNTLSHLRLPKVALPAFTNWGDIVRWSMKENMPGYFPFTAGVFPMRKEGEDAARLTAGEGGPIRSNRRFHYLTNGMESKRLSTAHDAVTLYGFDPDYRPDIFGKIGSTGVSISTIDDTKMLYAGFNLANHHTTSVNLTINGPSPMILAFYLNAAIDQQCELYIRSQGDTERITRQIDALYETSGFTRPAYTDSLPQGNDGLGLLLLGVSGNEVLPADIYERIKADTLKQVRGTVQCDILKEDQAQNTCIFSTQFSLKMMADIQEYFIAQQVRHFYSVSVSGYHIAEAGANPVTQIAFTLANAFSYIEYYLSRGMKIDDFAPNFSFFFSNGIDPEYAVLGRVARRIWAKVLKYKYNAVERSQKLKYHIQTSGRSLQSQDMDFNDIRTTLQALYAINDNCNSLHTNANDEAISLPTETTVRKALAIQKIIDKEFGLTKNQNPLQGSFIIEQLTDLVEDAVIKELENIARRGGVLAAMETMYQRSRIQEQSLHYEMLKHSGALPIVGVNTFVQEGGESIYPAEAVVRITSEEKAAIVQQNKAFRARNAHRTPAALEQLSKAAYQGKNIFETLIDVSRVCTLGQLSDVLFRCGGEYRRNM